MTKREYREYHERVAARLRGVAATATTAGVKVRLLEKAEEHERIARGEEEPLLTSADAPAP